MMVIFVPENVEAKTVKQTKYFDMNISNHEYTFPSGIAKAKNVKVKSSNPKVLSVKFVKHKEIGRAVKFVAKKEGSAKISISYTTGGKKKKYIYSYHVISKGKTKLAFGKQAFKIQNKFRTNKGKEKLQWSDELYQFALYRMKKHGFDFHKYLEQDTNDYFGTFGEMNHISFGENLTMVGPAPKSAMDSWKRSKDHYNNLLKSEYKCGAIVYYNESWCAIFSTEDASKFKNWKSENNNTIAITIKRMNSKTNEYVGGSSIQYYLKDDRWNSTKGKSINDKDGIVLFLEKGKTYVIREKNAPGDLEKAESVEITVTEDCEKVIVLK